METKPVIVTRREKGREQQHTVAMPVEVANKATFISARGGQIKFDCVSTSIHIFIESAISGDCVAKASVKRVHDPRAMSDRLRETLSILINQAHAQYKARFDMESKLDSISARKSHEKAFTEYFMGI